MFLQKILYPPTPTQIYYNVPIPERMAVCSVNQSGDDKGDRPSLQVQETIYMSVLNNNANWLKRREGSDEYSLCSKYVVNTHSHHIQTDAVTEHLIEVKSLNNPP